VTRLAAFKEITTFGWIGGLISLILSLALRPLPGPIAMKSLRFEAGVGQPSGLSSSRAFSTFPHTQ
jgi:hypothetical protein